VRWVLEQGHAAASATSHGASERIHPRDLAGSGIELRRDRQRPEWLRAAEGRLVMAIRRLDLEGLRREAA